MLKRPVYQDDNYFLCTAKAGQVYSTARRIWVVTTDADYLAWRTADGAGEPEREPTTFGTVAELRRHVLDALPGALPGHQEALLLMVNDIAALAAGQALSTDPAVSLKKRMDDARALVPD